MPKDRGQNSKPQRKPKPGERQMVSLQLTAGPWNSWFDDFSCKLLIAEALNYCVRQHGMQINGYLITGRQVYLVLFINPDSTHRMLMIFFEKLQRELQKLVVRKRSGFSFTREEELHFRDESYNSLFSSRPAPEPYLPALLRGEPVKFPYYDLRLEQLKGRLAGSNFCSVVDYSGGKGPVLISFSRKAASKKNMQ